MTSEKERAALTNSVSDIVSPLGSDRHGVTSRPPALTLNQGVFHQLTILLLLMTRFYYRCGVPLYCSLSLLLLIHSITIQPNLKERLLRVGHWGYTEGPGVENAWPRELTPADGGDGRHSTVTGTMRHYGP